MITYEELLNRDLDWALREGSLHFEEKNSVHRALQKIAKRLDELHIPYAVVGGMAMFLHGYRRFTEDVDLLVTREGLQEVHRRLEGLGYLPPFQGSKHLRDTELGVRVEFLVTGDYPGDGKPKPIAFPNPELVSEERNGIRCLQLPRLVELKLASGMSNLQRMRDLSDVVDMIRTLNLPRELADELDETVRGRYLEFWDSLQNAPPE